MVCKAGGVLEIERRKQGWNWKVPWDFERIKGCEIEGGGNGLPIDFGDALPVHTVQYSTVQTDSSN